MNHHCASLLASRIDVRGSNVATPWRPQLVADNIGCPNEDAVRPPTALYDVVLASASDSRSTGGGAVLLLANRPRRTFIQPS